VTIAEALISVFFPNSATPRLDIELLLAFALNKPKYFLYAYPEYVLTKEQENIFNVLIERRTNGEPIAYIIGKKEFWSFELKVNSNVLIPRPETEVLVEIALQNIADKKDITVVDLGTGSGAIALALAYSRPTWNVIATDISASAIEIARYNAANLQLKNIAFFCGDWCSVLPDKKFDLIVSNPPYITQNDYNLRYSNLRFEPKIALEAGDGFTDFKKIIMQAKSVLKKNGMLIFEHGYDQKAKLQELLQQNTYRNITSYKDLAGIDRVITAIL
jgi:release factor glutamine methyltransferase